MRTDLERMPCPLAWILGRAAHSRVARREGLAAHPTTARREGLAVEVQQEGRLVWGGGTATSTWADVAKRGHLASQGRGRGVVGPAQRNEGDRSHIDNDDDDDDDESDSEEGPWWGDLSLCSQARIRVRCIKRYWTSTFGKRGKHRMSWLLAG